MSNPGPLAERMLERAIENGLTPEADRFLEIRNRLLFGEGEVRDLSKADDPELYGRREAFNRLMWELFELGPLEERMILKGERISRQARAARWHRSVGKVPKTQELVVGARRQDQSSIFTLVREFSEAMEGIIDPGDVLVTSYRTVLKEEPLQDFERSGIWERLKEELVKQMQSSDDPNPIVDLYVRQEDKGRKGRKILDLRENVKGFFRCNYTARTRWEKLYLTIHWGDEQKQIEVKSPYKSSV